MIRDPFARSVVTSGISRLDELLGNLYIGDNVIWYDHAGSLAWIFCHNFVRSSKALKRPVIYVSFDRSPRTVLERLGPLADNPDLTILDCFTWGKGSGSEVFTSFYEEIPKDTPYRVVAEKNPRQTSNVMETLYRIHSGFDGDVRFVFESLTGMQDLWDGEDKTLRFYSHSCPRLYELNTVAYWIIEKEAHSARFRAQINQIAQVAINLSIKRGRTTLAVLKADYRDLNHFDQPHSYWIQGDTVAFEEKKGALGPLSLGVRLREARTKRGLSQTDLAKLVGVTPSTISQIETNLIFPSVPSLLKMAEVLSVEPAAFFQAKQDDANKVLFKIGESAEIKLPHIRDHKVTVKAPFPEVEDSKAEPYLIEISPKQEFPHFFTHRGEEIGCLLSGELQLTINNTVHEVEPGDIIHLTSETPSQWENPGSGIARLLWIKLK